MLRIKFAPHGATLKWHRNVGFGDSTDFEIIGTQARVLSIKKMQNALRLKLSSPDGVSTHVRLYCPKPVNTVKAYESDGEPMSLSLEWDDRTNTALFCYESSGNSVTVELYPE